MSLLVIVIGVLVVLVGSGVVWAMLNRKGRNAPALNPVVETVEGSIGGDPEMWTIVAAGEQGVPAWVNAEADIKILNPAKKTAVSAKPALKLYYRDVEIDLNERERRKIYDAFLRWTTLDIAQSRIRKYDLPSGGS